jgi:hypothetical protein
MGRFWRWVSRLGVAGAVGLVVGLVFGAGVIYALHNADKLGDNEQRQPAAFSEVGRQTAGVLAARFRPWLRFDTAEHWRPLSITTLLAEQRGGRPAHQYCKRTSPKPTCSPIENEAAFNQQIGRDGALGLPTYIDLAGERLKHYRGPGRCEPLYDCGAGPGSAIYYHVIQSNDRFYIDYWWFFRFNNFYRTHPRSSCRRESFRHNGVCDEHEGDWEGITVVTPPNEDHRLDYVVYAAHKATFRYAAAGLGLRGMRPEVFIARGSHASYPSPCALGCKQPIAFQGLFDLPESRIDGGTGWERNADRCKPNARGSCLLDLLRPDRGPQAWTAWSGLWGAGCEAVCLGKQGPSSPRSPGLQARYQSPWCSSQGGVFTCDSRALRCSDWLGPLVAVVACDPQVLSAGLRNPTAPDVGSLRLTVKRNRTGKATTPRKETTPGVVQALGDPLAPGDIATVTGGRSQTQLLVRAQSGRFLVEARFDKLALDLHHRAVIRVGEGAEGPSIIAAGRHPVERRIIEIDQPPKAAGR